MKSSSILPTQVILYLKLIKRQMRFEVRLETTPILNLHEKLLAFQTSDFLFEVVREVYWYSLVNHAKQV